MSQAQFVEVQRAIEHFPATELQKIKTKLDLKNLRSELLKLNMNEQFMKILARKYNLKYNQSDLMETSTPDVENISNVKQSGSYSTSNNQNISDTNQSGSCSTSTYQNISNVKTSDSNLTPGKKHNTCIKSSKYLLLNGMSNSTNPNKFIQKSSIESKHNLFQMFGINSTELESNLTKIFNPLKEFLGLMDKNFQGQFTEENNLDFVLRLLVRMSEIFSTKYGPTLESGTLIRCPYYFHAEVFSIEVSKNIFIIRALQNFDVPGYSMKRFQFELIMLLNEIIYYQKNLTGRLDSTLEIRGQANYNLTNFYIQNFTDSVIEVQPGDIIGRIFVGCSDNFIISPISQRREELIKMVEAVTESKLNADNYSTVTAISNMLETAQLSYKNTSSRLLNKNQKTDKINSLICQIKSKAQNKMNLEENIEHINFNKLRGKLNTILLSQYLLTTGHLISQGDLKHIQDVDRDINSLKKQCEEGHKNYLIRNGILYKKSIILGQTIYKLVLPNSLSRQVLEALHMKFETHQNTGQLAEIFGSTFHTKNLMELARNVVDGCLLCKLCSKQGKTTTGGAQRTFENNQTPGRIWVSDMCYLPSCQLGNKFAMILCEQLSSYVCVFPTQDLRS